MRRKLYESDGDGFSLPPLDDIIKGVGTQTLYRVQFKRQLESITSYGYNRAFTGSEGGNMYGPGTYCTYKLSDSISNIKSKRAIYGDIITKMHLIDGFKNFIIFRRSIAQNVYGQQWELRYQFMKVFPKITWDEAVALENEIESIGRAGGGNLYDGRTAPCALALWRKYRSQLWEKYGVRGLVYWGANDGHCALVFDFGALLPVEVSFDDGVTFKKIDRSQIQKAYDFISSHGDAEFRFAGKYKGVFKSMNGYTIVQNDENKYNVIQNKTNKPISDVWFDSVDGQISAETAVFGFTYKGYHFYGGTFDENGEINSDNAGCIVDDVGSPYCSLSDIDELVDYMKSNGIRNFDELLDMESNETDNTNESRDRKGERLVRRLVEKIVRKCAFDIMSEERTVDQDGMVTIDNFEDIKRLFIKPDNDDDTWFVQIIKRKKDNPDQHFHRNACEYIASFFIKDENDLDNKRNDIISVCKATNSRAYIHLNKRSLKSVNDYANNVLKPRFRRYNNRDFMGHEIDVAAGQPKDWPERKICFIDLDSNDVKDYNKVMKLLRDNNIKPLWEYRSTNNGWHIVLPDKEQVRNIDFSVIDDGYKYGRFATAGLEIDRPVLLYACLKPNGYDLQNSVQRHKRHNQGRRR